LDILTLLYGVIPWPGILVLLAIWIGGLLGAAAWRIRYRGGDIAADMVTALIGFASVSILVATQLIHYAGPYQWLGGFIFFVIDSAIFWVLLLAGIRAGMSLLFALLVSTFIGYRFCSVEALAILFCAMFFGLPVGSIAVMGRELLRANLPDKYFSQLCFPPRRYRKREIVDESYKTSVGHVAEW
jgi:hypothetical protein